MPIPGRWSGSAVGRLAPLLLACLALLVGAVPASAREVVVTGSKMNGFGRVLLQFDQPTKVSARTANSVLVISFAEPSKVKAEKLANELAPYVSTVRRDPDGTGLRLALAAPVRVNVLEAAERVFIDLLPPKWTGLPPGLPPEVVAELAARVQAAEAKLKAAGGRPAEAPRLVRLRIGEMPALTRLQFEVPPDLPVDVKQDGEEVELSFKGQVRFDQAGSKPKLTAGVADFEALPGAGGLTIRVRRAAGFDAQSFREPDGLVLDLARPQPPQELPEPAEQVPPPVLQATPAPDARGAGPGAGDRRASQSRPPAMAPAEPAKPGVTAAEGSAPSVVVARVEAGADGTAIVFPFGRRTPAAAFRRGGVLTLAFDTEDRLDTSSLAAATDPSLRPLSVRAEGGLTVLRLPEPSSGAVRFLAEGEGWRLTTGSAGGLPSDALKVSRGVDTHGRPLVAVGMAGASRAHWLRDGDGAKLAVVTASGRVQGLPLPRSFVEFGLASTIHGVVVEARADDVSVALGQNGVLIARDVGLTLSPASRGREDGGTASRLVLARDAWVQDAASGAFDRYAALVRDNAEAARAGRAEARFRLARFMLANGLNHEALSLLALARSEDAVFARRRDTLILSGIAAVRARRTAEARAFLSADGAAEESEAVLWRAAADALDKRWAAALAGFRRAHEIVELYPDDAAGPLRLLTLTAALEAGDVAAAESELGAIDRMATGSVPRDRHDLLRARVDEAAGRNEAALKAYRELMLEADLPVASEATLRATRLGVKAGEVDTDAAISTLENLSITWRGGEVEVGTLADLARFYGRAKRWRDMFTVVRRANRYFPTHPVSRGLHEEAAALLEGLLLGREGEQLTGLQALSLYFDFKELAPVGRRGDEIVRRLADRLVELDLLEQAADLLQYQVERRLTGAARATIAARLAAIRLLDRKPLMALSALHSTRLSGLPEEVRRLRYVLEARALADLSRTDLALEVLEGETGPAFDRLRTSILWNARRWREAGEAGEALLGSRWEGPDALSDRERSDVLRAAIAYVFADERISLDRLKQKFARKIMDSADARTFELILRPGAVETREFRIAAQEAARADTLRTFLADWTLPAGEMETDGTAPGAAEPPLPSSPRAESSRSPVPG